MRVLVLVPFKHEDDYYKRWRLLCSLNPDVDIHLYQDKGHKVSFRNFVDEICDVSWEFVDFICLVDVHCIVDFTKYLAYLETLPKEGVYEGFKNHAWGIDYCPGTGISFSRDVAQVLVDSVQDDHYYPDVTIGKILGEKGITITDRPFSLATTDTKDKFWTYYTDIEKFKTHFDRLLFGI
jgi:hypothetical protein